MWWFKNKSAYISSFLARQKDMLESVELSTSSSWQDTWHLQWLRHYFERPSVAVAASINKKGDKDIDYSQALKDLKVEYQKNLQYKDARISELKREEKKNQANHSQEVKDLKANFQKTLDAKDAKIGELERESSNICRLHLTKIFGRFSWILKISRS
jgi:hypothetical protein